MKEKMGMLLDEEWVELIQEALKLGVDPKEIREFLANGRIVSELQ